VLPSPCTTRPRRRGLTCKPFLYAALIARIRAVLRRAEGRRKQGVLRVRDLTIDPSTRIVRLGGRRIELSAKEFALLQALAIEPGRVYRKPFSPPARLPTERSRKAAVPGAIPARELPDAPSGVV
jgi:hypothetical protein